MPVNNLNEDASIIQPMKRPFLQQPVMNPFLIGFL